MQSNGSGVVAYRPLGDIDAIDEHSRRLVAALCAAGHDAHYVCGGLHAVRRRGCRPPWVLLQYNPFSYGRWGVAPGLIREAAALRRRGARVAVMVHESWIELRDWRTALMGAYQWTQLRSLLACSDAVLAATEALAGELGRKAVHTPVGSNITPLGVTSGTARERLGVGDELIVALFGTAHPSRALDYAEKAIVALASAEAGDVTVLNLGTGTPALDAGEGVRVDTPGPLGEVEISLRLSAADLCLLPFTDGLSTRRTTLMAALAHGLPVLGLRGTATDTVLTGHPQALMLTPAGDRPGFVHAAVEMAADRAALRARGESGRELYEAEFDWPVVARRVSAVVIDGATPSR